MHYRGTQLDGKEFDSSFKRGKPVIFQLEYGFSPWLWISGICGPALGIGLAGLVYTWPLVIRPPLRSLRQLE